MKYDENPRVPDVSSRRMLKIFHNQYSHSILNALGWFVITVLLYLNKLLIKLYVYIGALNYFICLVQNKLTSYLCSVSEGQSHPIVAVDASCQATLRPILYTVFIWFPGHVPIVFMV